MSQPLITALLDRATAPYRRSGRFAWHFARGKLARDPVFPALLRTGLFQTPTRILDLGCGQALLANWIGAAATLHHEGQWPLDWPPVAPYLSYRGIELMAADAQRGRTALPKGARVDCDDICEARFETADRILLLDVLHYLSPAAQETVLDKVTAALAPDGVFILRVGDGGAGRRFRQSWLIDHLVMWCRSRGPVRLHCRPLTEWRALLQARGFSVEAEPMSTGTPFANVLLVARHAQCAHSHDHGVC